MFSSFFTQIISSLPWPVCSVVGTQSLNWRVEGLIPSWGTYLRWGFTPSPGAGMCDPLSGLIRSLVLAWIPGLRECEGNKAMLLLHQCFACSLPLSLKNKNKQKKNKWKYLQVRIKKQLFHLCPLRVSPGWLLWLCSRHCFFFEPFLTPQDDSG